MQIGVMINQIFPIQIAVHQIYSKTHELTVSSPLLLWFSLSQDELRANRGRSSKSNLNKLSSCATNPVQKQSPEISEQQITAVCRLE